MKPALATHTGAQMAVQIRLLDSGDAARLDRAREVGCAEAWVLTDRSNPPALNLYSSPGGVEASRDQVMFTFRLNRDAGRQKPGRGASPAEGS